MSQAFDSTDYAERAASLPSSSAFAIAAWINPASLPASDLAIFSFYTAGGGTDLGTFRWAGATHTALRIITTNGSANITDDPSAGAWIYCFMRGNGANVEAGYKTIAQSDFPANQRQSVSSASGTPSVLRVGANVFYTTALSMNVHRLTVWDEAVSDANLLLAAATDLGYVTSINTHLPLSTGIGSPWNDTSGNARNWTASGTFSDESDPSFGSGTVDLAGAATAGASASAALAVQRNLASAAVAGAFASGALSINKALTGSAIAQALGSATLGAFSNVWRIPTNAANGTAVHVLVFTGTAPSYTVIAQGNATVAGGFADVPGGGTIGAKAFAFVHNYSDNTATTNIRGGPAIATLTSL